MAKFHAPAERGGNESEAVLHLIMNLLLLILLIVVLLSILPTWPYSSGWGYYPSGTVGLIIVILLILLLTGRI